MKRPTFDRGRRSLEGHCVSLVLTDGSRLENVRLVLSGRARVQTLWLEVDGVDRFVEADQVTKLIEFTEGRAA
jgi:transcriptional antiterminator Rof (Rho-off)